MYMTYNSETESFELKIHKDNKIIVKNITIKHGLKILSRTSHLVSKYYEKKVVLGNTFENQHEVIIIPPYSLKDLKNPIFIPDNISFRKWF